LTTASSSIKYGICFQRLENQYDVIVIGGGYQRLTNTAYLARELAKMPWFMDRRKACQRKWHEFVLDSPQEMR